jgi:hypothetical protein
LEEFTNNSVSFETLPKFESVPLQPLNRDYLNVVYIGNAVFAIILSIGTLIFLWVKEESQPLILPIVGATVILIALLSTCIDGTNIFKSIIFIFAIT